MRRALRPLSRRLCIRPSILCVLLIAGLIGGGCGDESGSSYDIGRFLGSGSTFEVTVEGVFDDVLAGTAEFRTDAEGALIGIDLIHIEDSTRGISIELEPHALAPRTYEVVTPGLMGIERAGQPAGFTAFFESGAHSFRATRGTLRVTQTGDTYVHGTMDLQMDGVPDGGSLTTDGVALSGTFQATRPEG